jgi:CRP-like cAMP-binding protein
MADRRRSHVTNLTDRAIFLANAPVFRDLAPQTLAAIARRMRRCVLDDGSFVFLAGTTADAVNLLVEGRIKVIRETEGGHEVILRMIQPGELFGGAGGWGEAVYPASAVALGDSVVLRLPATDFTALISEHADFAMAIIHQLAERLRLAERRIEELQTQRVERRIAHTLLRLAEKTGVKTPDGIRIDLPLTRQDLADLAGTTLSTASRTLSNWDRLGLIDAGRERVTILAPHRLVAVAEDLPVATPKVD